MSFLVRFLCVWCPSARQNFGYLVVSSSFRYHLSHPADQYVAFNFTFKIPVSACPRREEILFHQSSERPLKPQEHWLVLYCYKAQMLEKLCVPLRNRFGHGQCEVYLRTLRATTIGHGCSDDTGCHRDVSRCLETSLQTWPFCAHVFSLSVAFELLPSDINSKMTWASLRYY